MLYQRVGAPGGDVRRGNDVRYLSRDFDAAGRVLETEGTTSVFKSIAEKAWAFARPDTELRAIPLVFYDVEMEKRGLCEP